MSAWDVLMNVFLVDCDGWRLVVCQVSVWEIHDDENGIVERIVVEVVDVVKLKDDGWVGCEDVAPGRLGGGVGWT